MKKIIVSLVLVFSLFFAFGNLQTSAEEEPNYYISKNYQIKIDNFLNNYFDKIEKKYGKEKTNEKLQKIIKKIITLTNNGKTEKYSKEYLEIFKYISDNIAWKIRRNSIELYFSYIEKGELDNAFKLRLDSMYGSKEQRILAKEKFKKLYNFSEKVKIDIIFPLEKNIRNEVVNVGINYLESKKRKEYIIKDILGLENFGLESNGEIGLEEYYKRLIEKYYYNISRKSEIKQNFIGAYNMKYNPKISFENFKKLYQTNIKNIYVPKNFKKIGNLIFQFRVDLYEGKLENKGENFKEAYKITMKIVDDKLETLTTEKINSEILEEKSFGNKRAIIKWEDGEKKLYLDGKIIKKVEKIKNEFYGLEANIYGLEFLGNGNILKYDMGGREWSMTFFYNIKTGKSLELDNVKIFGITKDNKYLYACGESGMAGGAVYIYNYYNFNLIKDLSEGKVIYKCNGYDKNKNIFKYELSSYDDDLEKESFFKREYNFNF